MNAPARPAAAPRILYEDELLLGLEKPTGWNVFGQASLAAWLLAVRPDLAGVGPAEAPAIAHRLDRETSGLMLAAKDREGLRALRAQLSGQGCRKGYLAVLEGRLEGTQVIETPLGGRYRRSARVSVAAPGRRLRGVRPARTELEPLCPGEEASLCLARIGAGMRHQIRAHLAHLGHPLWGDRLYGSRRAWPAGAPGFLLHAWTLELTHPGSGAPLRLACPAPESWRELLATLSLPSPPAPPGALDSARGLG
ncbi:MAG TPA: RluA family pseudouridine synthase [Myxococcota bacterium]|nr:RluA family pseudouridine synthase [Myxococcota bacterium]HRY92924.1 RluA family pseudouridine synthase [Myxococcota bacterium]HSA19857.1 RluA family pseudouridine synthase [Myxococcota bacterium]